VEQNLPPEVLHFLLAVVQWNDVLVEVPPQKPLGITHEHCVERSDRPMRLAAAALSWMPKLRAEVRWRPPLVSAAWGREWGCQIRQELRSLATSKWTETCAGF